MAMASTIDEITINWSDDKNVLVRKELEKEVLTRGSWSTIVFLYQELDRKTNDYGPHKVSIRRYQKGPEGYRDRSKFNISNVKQAHQIIDVLHKWFPEKPTDDGKSKKKKKS